MMFFQKSPKFWVTSLALC